MADTNKSKKKLILWTILFAPYGAYLMFKQKEYKMLGVVFLLGIISLVFFEPPKKPQTKPVAKKTAPLIPIEDIYAQARIF